jgi:alkanesulfonate monooxygenase SsuD/methylene tetrahydromethanopterin reductase-like flavin-dependent oxidoreductase (luciferase family)
MTGGPGDLAGHGRGGIAIGEVLCLGQCAVLLTIHEGYGESLPAKSAVQQRIVQIETVSGALGARSLLCRHERAEMRDVEIMVSFDMRAPDWGPPPNELYRAAIEMAAFADRIGVDQIGLMEHHGSDDGYLPQPFTLAAGMAAVTTNVRFILGAVILPLHDPVLIAEQIAITDLLSNGRINVIFGAGYVPFEFAMFRKSLKDHALRGEEFETDGRPVCVRPLPVQAPEDIILVGGGVEASVRRAVRFGLGLAPLTPELVDLYIEECRKHRREPGLYWRPSPPISIHLCEDPDQGWAAIERHAVHVITEYAKWAEQEGDTSNSPFKGLTDPAVLRHAGLFAAWTPDELVAKVPEMVDRSTVGFQPLLGGLSPEEGWKSLKLLEQTMPKLKAAIAALHYSHCQSLGEVSRRAPSGSAVRSRL